MSGGTATRSWLFYAALGNPLFTHAYGYLRGKLHGVGVLAREEFGANEIVPGLWLGDIYDAHNVAALQERRIANILTCVRGVEPSFPEKLDYLSLDAMDVSEQDMAQFFKSTNAFIHGVLSRSGTGGDNTKREEAAEKRAGALGSNGDAVLVHCMQGVSRSSTVVLAYLMRHRGMSFEDALALAQEKRPRVKPNAGFVAQLQRYEKEIGNRAAGL